MSEDSKKKHINKNKSQKIKSKKLVKETANTKTLIDKAKTKNKQRKNKIRVYYSLLTMVLLACVAQIGFSAIFNITKDVSYHTKINTMKKTKEQAERRNKKLKQDIKNFSSASSLEAIARNNLKMAGKDEVLVIINTANEAKNKNNKHQTIFKR
ncbi:septum formation initiator family protein [bacterium]|nr:septum formation initiator family protein [bacterium]